MLFLHLLLSFIARPEEVSFGEGNDFVWIQKLARSAALEADFKCSENVFWRDQWSSGLKQFCCPHLREHLVARTSKAPEARASKSVRISRPSWALRLLRLTGSKSFLRRSTPGDLKVVKFL